MAMDPTETLKTLQSEACQPCRAGDPGLGGDALALLSATLPDWNLSADGQSLQREFSFDSYAAGLARLNQVAALAERLGHHPDLDLGYKRLMVRWTTHATHGLSRNDFIGAAQTDALPVSPA